MGYRIGRGVLLIEALLLILLISPASSSSRDVAVLLRVKGKLEDPNGRLADWVETARNAPCNWTGITCDPHGNDVVSVDLTSFCVSGNFPADFCRISTLKELILYDNYLGGAVSSDSISLCSRLRSINLSSNVFVGELPELRTGFTNLSTLDFSRNNFTGAIPASFGRLRALQVFSLAGNFLNGSFPEFLTNLTELILLGMATNPFKPSPLPSTIGRLTKLEVLWLTDTQLVGDIPESIGGLVALKNLDLSQNRLSGKVPESIGGLKSVEQLELFKNKLSGELPNSFANLTSLLRFDASENRFTGKIPESLAGLSMESFNINDNYLEGEIPAILALNPKLKELKIFNNKFSGTLPVNLGMNSDLENFDVSGNQFEGPLPPNLCHRKKLQILITFNNRFSGSIPESCADCDSINYIRISNNELSGQVPARFWSFPGLNMIQFENNRLEGSIPPSISRLVTQLLISGNNFSGELPPEICGMQHLGIMDLSSNQFSGKLPSCITKMKKLQKLDLQENSFTGEIPNTVGAWKELTELDLSKNKFSGSIPGELGTLPVLTYLDLSDNLLTGEIPASLSKLKLNKFNISNNKLDGVVPQGFNNDFYAPSLTGNPNLCSPDLKSFPRCSRRKSVSVYLIGILSAFSFILVASLVWLLIKTKKLYSFGRKNKRSWKITSFQRVGFGEEDVLASLTDNNLIGTGSSARVYRVKLKNGQPVAIKRLWEGNRRLENEGVFLSELEILGRIRHGNIVKLLFSCIGEDFRLLAYEYMANGSLESVLHGDKGGSLLDWPKRFEIAVGSAQGLAYLHHDCVPAIVHRDVKPNNILLDEELRPRVADFGLAKTLQKHVMEGDKVMSRVAGSYGYIAPEYAYTLKVNEKSDVYSYGIVLLELITGKKPNDASFGENKDLVKWIMEHTIMPANQGSGTIACSFTDLEELIDPRMNPSTQDLVEIEKALNVAVLCISAFPINRPSMRKVVELLKDRSLLRSK